MNLENLVFVVGSEELQAEPSYSVRLEGSPGSAPPMGYAGGKVMPNYPAFQIDLRGRASNCTFSTLLVLNV